ncbi:MAG: hypothetical protein WBG38_12950 [Nodosilinea sp.]
MPDYLTTASTVICPHGGRATLFTANAGVTAAGAFVLLETDVHLVAGCPFTVGLKYSPCVQIVWAAGAAQSHISGIPGLVRTSQGHCYSAENNVQGVAVIVNTQPKADSR